MEKKPEQLNSSPSRVAKFWTIMTITCRVESGQVILQISDSALTRLRIQTFMIRLENESRVGTPLRQNLLKSEIIFQLHLNFVRV